MEWSVKNKYNSFNSMKGLAYYESYKAIAKWLDGDPYLPPPIECSLDPIAVCNHRCYYCNSQRYLRDNPAEITKRELSWGEMYGLIVFLKDWGVRGLCFGGGGESTLNWEVPPVINIALQKGLEVSLVTNGSMLYDGCLQESLMNCRWVGISLDASDKKTFLKTHRVDMFDKTLVGIRRLVALKKEKEARVDIAIKFLVLPENADSIYDACLLAKDIGVDDFHVRPVDLERKDYKMARKLNFDIDKIKESFARCHKEETDNFHVYTVMHKYDEEFHVTHGFSKCLTSPLVLQACTDGKAYACVDHRMEDRFYLGDYLPDPAKILDWWGSNRHRKLVKSIKPHQECSRCTWSEYNRQMEDCVLEDKLCLAFP